MTTTPATLPRTALALALLLAAALAGCMDGDEAPDAYASARSGVRAAAASVLHLEHDVEAGHRLGQLHRGSHNVELVGYSNGVDDSGDPDAIPPKGLYNEVALHGGHAFLSRTSADGTFGGFSIVDVSDPASPRVVGEFKSQGGNDVEVDDTGRLAFVATQRNTPEQLAGGLQTSGDAAGALGRGIQVVDVSDPRAPTLAAFVPLPYNGPHTLTWFRHPNGEAYLVACTYDLVTDPGGAIVGAAPVTQRLIVYLVAESDSPVPGTGVSLLPVAQYQRTGAGMAFPHDTAVEVHPLAERVVLTVAYWDQGVRFLDFTDPPQPAPETGLPTLGELGAFTDFSPSALNALHLAKPFGQLLEAGSGSVHVTVAEPEVINAANETGQLTFVDSSDPAHPRKLSWWTLPPQDPPLAVRNLDFSPHNFDTFGSKLAVAHYHAGLWVVDLSTPENVAEPKEVGFYMTARPRTNSPAPQPYAWDVDARDGLLYVSDEASGLYILRYVGP